MKNLILVISLTMSIPGYSEAIPSPSVLFSLSERIINEAQNFLFPIKEGKTKKRAEEKDKDVLFLPVKNSEEWIWNPLEIKRDGMWIVSI